MSLTLYVDGTRLRAHVTAGFARHPGIVPITRGNGYGLSNQRLALEAESLRADTLAVGTYDEIDQVAGLFRGSIVVLTAYRPFGSGTPLTPNPRVIHTISRVEDLTALLAIDPGARILLERMTSLRVHGLSARELRQANEILLAHPAAILEGIALHFPRSTVGHLAELHRLMNDVAASGLPTRSIWITHLSDPELVAAHTAYPEVSFRPCLGSALWLTAPEALRVRAHVLDLHRLERGSTFGEQGRIVPRRGHVLVLSGGTSHGIGLEAPNSDPSLKSRATTLARGSLDAAGLVRSPYIVDGKPRFFAEPPHQQASLVYLPEEARVPAIGDEVDLRVRMTTTTFDRTLVS